MRHIIAMLLAATVVLGGAPTQAQSGARAKIALNRLESAGEPGVTTVLPFVFNAESTGPVVGAGGIRRGFYQEQMTVGGAAFVGEESYGITAGVWDYRFGFSRRLFITATGMAGYYPNHRAYAAPRELFLPPDVIRPGANESSPDAFLASEGASNWWDIKLEYVLPIGASDAKGRLHFDLERGLITSEASGGKHWNPLKSGSTILMFRQYNRYQDYVLQDGERVGGTVHPMEFGVRYDNTDFPINPSRGSRQYVAVHHDAAWLDSQEKWTFVEAEASKYISLGESRWASQRIVALNAWTGYSPTWQLEFDEDGGSRVRDAPPFMEGSTLGGFYRLRGYRDSRFHDKAAAYATAEYRLTLRDNPIRSVPWLQFLSVDWFQLVGFVEGGRVAPTYQPDTLLRDWKSDVGVGLRALFAGTVVRFDVARSDEGTNFWIMVGHPF